MEATYIIFRYLKGCLDKSILYRQHGNPRVEAYTNVDWVGSIFDCWSTYGYYTFVGGNLVTWQSKKQSLIARSSVEAKFRSMVHGTCKLLWLRMWLIELDFHVSKPMSLYCDKATINIAHDLIQHDKNNNI